MKHPLDNAHANYTKKKKHGFQNKEEAMLFRI